MWSGSTGSGLDVTYLENDFNLSTKEMDTTGYALSIQENIVRLYSPPLRTIK